MNPSITYTLTDAAETVTDADRVKLNSLSFCHVFVTFQERQGNKYLMNKHTPDRFRNMSRQTNRYPKTHLNLLTLLNSSTCKTEWKQQSKSVRVTTKITVWTMVFLVLDNTIFWGSLFSNMFIHRLLQNNTIPHLQYYNAHTLYYLIDLFSSKIWFLVQF